MALPCIVLPCTEASDVPGVYQGLQLAVPSHRRELQTQVSTSAELLSALANTAVGRIVLAPGTYILSAELNVNRSVVLEAAVAGSVVLDAQASSSSLRRVLNIDPGSLGIVQLIGVNITGGYMNSQGGGGVYVSSGTVTITSSSITGNTAAGYVRALCKTSHCPDGKTAPRWETHDVCSLIAGRRCLCLWWHSVNRELPDLLQHSYLCARCFSKFPIAPMGKRLTRLI